MVFLGSNKKCPDDAFICNLGDTHNPVGHEKRSKRTSMAVIVVTRVRRLEMVVFAL